MLGNAVAPIALAFAVLDLTGSARDLGLVVGARSLTNVAFLLFGGVIADRLPRHLVMVGASVLAALTQFGVAASVLTGEATIPLLVALSAVNGIASAIALPAAAALVPQTVPPEIRQQANAISRLAFNTAMILGASLGGVLVATVGPGWGLAVDALAFAVAAIVFALVRVPAVAAAPAARQRILTDLREGWSEFSSRTWLWSVVAGFAVTNAALAGGLNVLGPVVADDTIGRPAWGLVLAIETVGMVVGGIVALKLRIRRFLRYGVVCCFGDVLLLGALGLTPHIGVLLLCAFLAGFALEQFAVAWETTMQEHVPADKLARVYSYDMLGSFVAIPLGQVVAGPLAERYGASTTLVAAAVLCLLAVVGMLCSRDVRRIEHALPAPPPILDSLPGTPDKSRT
jgi:MFS family permease